MASPLTIQPSSKDNYLNEAAPTTNYGTGTALIIYASITAGYRYRILVEFSVDWGTDVPAGATITSAILYLYYYYYNPGGRLDPVGRTIYADRLLRLDWHETQSTWNIYKTGSNWTTAGAGSNGNDHTITDRASAVIPASYDWMEWDITEQVKTAQTGDVNVACLLRDSVEVPPANNYMPYWYSKEYAVDPTKCPKLVITYTYPISSSLDLGFATSVSRSTTISRLSQPTMGFAATASRVISATRTASTTLGFETLAERVKSKLVEAITSIGFAVSASRSYAANRLSEVELGFYNLASLYEKIKRRVKTIGTNRGISTTGTNRTITSDSEKRDIEEW